MSSNGDPTEMGLQNGNQGVHAECVLNKKWPVSSLGIRDSA